MNRLLLATIIFFVGYLGTIVAIVFLAYGMYLGAAISYAAGWVGWGIAFLIGGHEFVKRRKYYKMLFKNYLKRVYKKVIK